MRIAVAGATGLVGEFVVASASDRGHEVVAISKSKGLDLVTGEGLVGALHGVDVVIDVTNKTTLSAKVARTFFSTVTTNLLRAEARTGVKHHVALSIVGIDAIDAGYYAGKLEQERILREGSVPFTIARATQFHEFATQQLQSMAGPIALLPKCLMRPVAAREVGQHLVEIAEGRPLGRAQDLVGPKNEVLADLARRQLAFDGSKKLVLEFPLPGVFGRGMASGSLRGQGNGLTGSVSFDDWLESADHQASLK